MEYSNRRDYSTMEKANYPVISVYIDDIQKISEKDTSENSSNSDTTFSISVYPKISKITREKTLAFVYELINYFTPNLLLHHQQDEVPVFTIYLGVSESQLDINTYGGYYTKFIHSIPELQDILEDLFLMVRDDLDITRYNVDEIISELQNMPRIDIKENLNEKENKPSADNEDLDWTYNRIIRTPYSEVYSLHLNNENAGQIHIHIGKNIDTTIITTVDITEKEKAVLMGMVHETLLELLEEEHKTHSTINFYSEAVEDID